MLLLLKFYPLLVNFSYLDFFHVTLVCYCLYVYPFRHISIYQKEKNVHQFIKKDTISYNFMVWNKFHLTNFIKYWWKTCLCEKWYREIMHELLQASIIKIIWYFTRTVKHLVFYFISKLYDISSSTTTQSVQSKPPIYISIVLISLECIWYWSLPSYFQI